MAAATSTKQQQQPKMVEKKLMDEKIAKVREVVKNISTNDIVLALHNFELDVERTIHAFCEGGSEIALGDWEKTSTAKKRNHKKKPKAAVNGGGGGPATGNLTKGTFGTSSISSSISSATYSNGFPSSNNNNHNNFAANSVFQPPSQMFNGGLSSTPSSATTPKSEQQNGGNPTPSPFLLGGETLNVANSTGADKPGINILQKQNEANQVIYNIIDSTGDTFGLADNLSHLEQNKQLFENEITYAHENIQRCFKELRDTLAHREQQLLAELVECQRQGCAYFSARANEAKALSSKQHSNTKAFAAQLEKFNAAKTEDLETALCARFLYESEYMLSAIKQYAKVIPVNNKMATLPPAVAAPSAAPSAQTQKKNAEQQLAQPSATTAPAAAAIRRSNSPSSLVSSVDSGLGGQFSPVHQAAEKGPVARVEENGIVLKSDSVSADQLAEIQRHIMDSLRAKGIDPAAVMADLNSVGGNFTAPRRRPAPPQSSSANNHSNNRNGGADSSTGHGKQGGGGGAKQQQQQNHQRPPRNGAPKSGGGGSGNANNGGSKGKPATAQQQPAATAAGNPDNNKGKK